MSAVTPRPLRLGVALGFAGGIGLMSAAIAIGRAWAAGPIGAYLALWTGWLAPERTRRERAGQFVLVHASVALLLALIELPALLGVVDYRVLLHVQALAPHRDPNYRFDPELMFIRPPFDRVAGTYQGGDISFLFHTAPEAMHVDAHYDEHGLRNPAGIRSAQLAVVGDSVVEGAYVGDDEVLTARLRADGIPTLNLAQIHYGPDQELVLLLRYGLPAGVRDVAWVFFEGNDLKNLREFDTWRGRMAEAHAEYHSAFARAFLRSLTARVFAAFARVRPSGAPRSGMIHTAAGARRAYFLYPGVPLAATTDADLARLRGVLARARDACNARGARLEVVFAPIKYRVYAPLLGDDAGREVRTWVVNELPDRVRAAVGSLGDSVGYLDLTPALQASAREGRAPFFATDSHWSAEGHAVAAREIASALRRARLARH